MKLYLSNTAGLDPALACRPPRSGRRGSAFGMSLLALALRTKGLEAMPPLGEDAMGKPFFPDCPGLCFSLSHSGGYVACALGDTPLGVDVQVRRPLTPQLCRLAEAEEAGGLLFFDLWVLRESLFKLTGQGDLRRTPFRLAPDGRPCSPDYPDVRFHLYDLGPEAALALAWQTDAPFPQPVWVPGEQLLR